MLRWRQSGFLKWRGDQGGNGGLQGLRRGQAVLIPGKRKVGVVLRPLFPAAEQTCIEFKAGG